MFKFKNKSEKKAFGLPILANGQTLTVPPKKTSKEFNAGELVSKFKDHVNMYPEMEIIDATPGQKVHYVNPMDDPNYGRKEVTIEQELADEQKIKDDAEAETKRLAKEKADEDEKARLAKEKADQKEEARLAQEKIDQDAADAAKLEEDRLAQEKIDQDAADEAELAQLEADENSDKED